MENKVKQWRNSNLGVIYFHLPNSKNDEILTSDGVLIPFNEFKTMSAESYNAKKNSNGGYDYNLSLQSEKLVKKTITKKADDDFTMSTNKIKEQSNNPIMVKMPNPTEEELKKVFGDDYETKDEEIRRNIRKQMTPYTYDDGRKTNKTKTETTSKEVQKSAEKKIEKKSTQPKKEIKKEEKSSTSKKSTVTKTAEKKTVAPKSSTVKPKTEIKTPTIVEVKKEEVKPTVKEKEITPIVAEPKVTPIINEVKKDETKKERFNLFEFAYPKIMLILTVICSILSIYFTATYLQRLQSILLAYAISTCMLLYGLVGFQIGRKKRREGHHGQAFVYFTTSILTILFSMLSSLDVNYAKYKVHHADEEVTYNTNDGVRMSYDILKQELEDNKIIISNAQKDIEFQQTQWVLAWDNDLKKNVLLEGRISATAQEKIKEDNQRIEELTERNKEINQQLIEYAQSGITMNKSESKLEKSKSLTDLLGTLLHLSGDLIQLIFLLVPSLFIDLIGLMAMSIYTDSFENKKL